MTGRLGRGSRSRQIGDAREAAPKVSETNEGLDLHLAGPAERAAAQAPEHLEPGIAAVRKVHQRARWYHLLLGEERFILFVHGWTVWHDSDRSATQQTSASKCFAGMERGPELG